MAKASQKSESARSGPPDGPAASPAYDANTIPTVDVRLQADRTLAFRLEGKNQRWQGAFADMAALSIGTMKHVDPPYKINFTIEDKT